MEDSLPPKSKKRQKLNDTYLMPKSIPNSKGMAAKKNVYRSARFASKYFYASDSTDSTDVFSNVKTEIAQPSTSVKFEASDTTSDKNVAETTMKENQYPDLVERNESCSRSPEHYYDAIMDDTKIKFEKGEISSSEETPPLETLKSFLHLSHPPSPKSTKACEGCKDFKLSWPLLPQNDEEWHETDINENISQSTKTVIKSSREVLSEDRFKQTLKSNSQELIEPSQDSDGCNCQIPTTLNLSVDQIPTTTINLSADQISTTTLNLSANQIPTTLNLSSDQIQTTLSFSADQTPTTTFNLSADQITTTLNSSEIQSEENPKLIKNENIFGENSRVSGSKDTVTLPQEAISNFGIRSHASYKQLIEPNNVNAWTSSDTTSAGDFCDKFSEEKPSYSKNMGNQTIISSKLPICSNRYFSGDEFDAFAKLVACQLRLLPLERSLECQNVILQIVINERMKMLACPAINQQVDTQEV